MTGRTARAAGSGRALLRVLALGVALGVAVVTAGPAGAVATAGAVDVGPRAAQAADPAQVDVRLTGVSPGTLAPGAVLSVTGEIRNVGTATLGQVTVRVHIRPERIQTRAAIDAWASGGQILDDGPTVVTTTVDGRIAPGARASFAARKAVDPSFGLPPGSASFGPRAMTVEVLAADVAPSAPATADAALRPRTVGDLRTFTVWSPERTPPTLRFGVLVPLVDIANARVDERAAESGIGNACHRHDQPPRRRGD